MTEDGKRHVKDFPISEDFTLAIVTRQSEGREML